MAGQGWIRGRLLGAGAFGSVNLAIDREDGGVFAVKSVVVGESSSGVAERAIENEIEMLQRLDSKHVVRYVGSDWTEENGQVLRNAFLEYMPEGCLVDFVRQFASAGVVLDEGLLRTYTRSVVEGVEYLHRQGIVHCDIKGKNILVGNGCVKLTDFGSAKRLGRGGDGESEVVVTTNCAGTPLWMAPEVVRQVEQGYASDIWSLGCTVVEMATGRAPWSHFANQFAALYHIGCTEELPEVPESLSEDAHDFLSHCFQRDPTKRWTSAQLLQHPFLTTKFVAAPAASKLPASPVSVMHFPDSDSEFSDSFVNSVPTLAAPSLFKRGLVSAHHVEENWWSSTLSPDSGPWIVVRSPKSSGPVSSFAAPESDTTTTATITTLESPIPSDACTAAANEYQTTAITTVALSPPSCSFSLDDSVVGFSADAHVRNHFAISEMDFSVALMRVVVACNYACRVGVSGKRPQISVKEVQGSFLNTNSCPDFGTISEYSQYEFFSQFSNPQILLYWWPDHRINRSWLPKSSSYRDHFKYLKLSGHSGQICISQILDEIILLLKRPRILASISLSQQRDFL